jgi:hypothetical protein
MRLSFVRHGGAAKKKILVDGRDISLDTASQRAISGL